MPAVQETVAHVREIDVDKYKYGFSTDIESVRAPKGLSEDVVRFISAFAILAGAIILASTVAGTRLRRTRESAVFKTLGARRGLLISIFSVEFAILGLVAGLMGAGLATTFSRLLLLRFLDAKWSFALVPNLTTIALTTLLAVAAGWIASIRILSQRPLEVLRDE